MKLTGCESRGEKSQLNSPALFKTTVPSKAGLPVLMVRILLRATFTRKPCGERAVALQWNYYEKHKNAAPFRVPANLRVLRAVVEIGGLPEVAAAFGVSESTVRTHVRRLFEKLGAKRQADLIKVVAGFSNPLLMY